MRQFCRCCGQDAGRAVDIDQDRFDLSFRRFGFINGNTGKGLIACVRALNDNAGISGPKIDFIACDDS